MIDFCLGETSAKETYTTKNSYTTVLKVCSIKRSAFYDATAANWGAEARMPTENIVKELFNNCIHFWDVENDVEGMRFVSNVNGNTIFFPLS